MERKSLNKAYEITDAKISFVSLVDRAANKRTFLLTKQEDGKAEFTSYGKIVKADQENHYVTGIVYEPLTEDVHGNFMTEDEITKACYWFAKNGDKVDLQHSFDPLPGATVVENWISKSDCDIEGTPIKKGTWLMTVEVSDEDIWTGITNGEITGFSMGGVGTYSEEDTDLSNVEKSNESSDNKSLLKKIGKALGFNIVEKGDVAELYAEKSKSDNFWAAFDSLEYTLRHYDSFSGKYVYETDEDTIRNALSQFDEIVTSLLSDEAPIAKAIANGGSQPLERAGKSLSTKNKETLQGIYDSLGTFLAAFEDPDQNTDTVSNEGDENNETASDDDKKEQPEDEDENKDPVKKEEIEMTKSEVESMVQEAVSKAVEALKAPVEKSEEITSETIQKMVDEAIQKAAKPQEETVTAEDVQAMVTKAVDNAIQPLLKSRGLPSNLNDESGKKVEKSEEHYLHGIL